MKIHYSTKVTGVVALLACGLAAAPTLTHAQVNRAIDGVGNNLAHPTRGAAHAPLQRWTPACYPDSMGAPVGALRPSARVISNRLFDQPDGIDDRMALSDFTWVFGQFMDHDISLTPDGPELFFVPVPRGDTDFDPFNTGSALIPMRRSAVAAGTGTAPGNPRQHDNEITAFIDGSGVYGSTPARAAWLRTGAGGKLKVSPGDLLPYNTLDNTRAGDVDPTAPGMDNPFGHISRLYVAGDVRANENPLLATLHTVFVREHNRQCDMLAARHPGWDDEALYQRARKLVGGIIQSITYNEWLPAMGVALPAYTGYRPTVDPTIANEFSAAAFRVGHTLLNGKLHRLNSDGTPHALGPLTLRDAFFNIDAIDASGGVDPFVQGMAEQMQQNFDARVLDDVRNFLFGAPGRGGLDLVSINIQRGRDRGLIDYNGFREAMGLPRITSWAEVIAEPARAGAIDSVYGGVDDVDLWVGLLAEDAPGDQLFGPTLARAMAKQFAALRDGDRYFYLVDPALSAADRAVIDNTRFSDVLRRTTGVAVMQGNVFLSMPHAMVPACTAAGADARLAVQVALPDGGALTGAQARLYGFDDDMPTALTDGAGVASFLAVPTCDDYVVDLNLAATGASAAAGLTVADLFAVGQHILGFAPLTAPHDLLAADVNRSGRVTSFDMSNMRRVLLELDTAFLGHGPWRVLDATEVLPAGADALAHPWRTQVSLPRLAADSSVSFTAIKVGDLNGTFSLAGTRVAPRSTVGLQVAAVAGSPATYQVGFRQNTYVAHQYRLRVGAGARIQSVRGLAEEAFALSADGRTLTVAHVATDGDADVTLVFDREITAGQISLDADFVAEAYGLDGEARGLDLRWGTPAEGTTLARFAPTQLAESSTLTLPRGVDAAEVTLTVSDELGRVLLRRGGLESVVTLRRDELPEGFVGLLAYELNGAEIQPISGILLVP